MKLSSKICMASILVTFLVVGSCGFVARNILMDAFSEDAERNVALLAERGGEKLRRVLFDKVENSVLSGTRKLERIYQENESIESDETKKVLLSEFFNILDSVPEILSAGIYVHPKEESDDAKFSILYSQRVEGKGAPWDVECVLGEMPEDDFDNAWYWIPFRTGEKHWDDPGEWEGSVMMAYTLPLRKKDGTVAGVI